MPTKLARRPSSERASSWAFMPCFWSLNHHPDPNWSSKRFEGWEAIFSKKGDWVEYDDVDFGQNDVLNGFALKAKFDIGKKFTIIVHVDSKTGPVVGKFSTINLKLPADVSATGTFKKNWGEKNPKGVHNIFVELAEGENVAVDWISFE